MHHAGIIGTGSYVPEKILTNHDLEAMVETSDKWILERTGIRERRIAGEEETNVTMGRLALERAAEDARIDLPEIDLLVVGTNTTDPMWPSAAGHIAHLLNLRRNLPFFDVQAGCTGFNYSLAVAEQFVKSGQYKTVAESILVVAQGQAKANDALSRSISPILVQYKGIEKWNGILPQVSGGAVPFIDLGKMGGSSGGAEGTKK